MQFLYNIASSILAFFLVGALLDHFVGGKGRITIFFIILAVLNVFYQAYKALMSLEAKGPKK